MQPEDDRWRRGRDSGRRAPAACHEGHGLVRGLPPVHLSQPQRPVRGGVRGRRVHHLHGHGFTEQGITEVTMATA